MERGAPERQECERGEHVCQMTPGLFRSSRDEVVEALRHPDLGQAGERSEDEDGGAGMPNIQSTGSGVTAVGGAENVPVATN